MQTSQGVARGGRDRFLDVVRAGAILAVIAQHWVMPVLSYSGGQLATGNALATPGWWVVTWLSQVMPLVFFAGGAANLISLRRADSPRQWLAARIRRLMVPVLPLLAVWLVVPDFLRGLGIPPQPLQVASAIAAQLLWFLAVYVLVVLLTPVMVAAHRRWGLKVPLVMAVAGVLVDVARFNDLGYIGYANAIFVWVAVHQLGFHYVEGRLGSLTRRGALTLSAAGFGVTALMVAFGPYPASMIGMPGAPVSNMSPPTVLLAFLAVGQIGLLLAFRPQLNALAERPGVGTALSWLGARFMTVYLWHIAGTDRGGGRDGVRPRLRNPGTGHGALAGHGARVVRGVRHGAAGPAAAVRPLRDPARHGRGDGEAAAADRRRADGVGWPARPRRPRFRAAVGRHRARPGAVGAARDGGLPLGGQAHPGDGPGHPPSGPRGRRQRTGDHQALRPKP